MKISLKWLNDFVNIVDYYEKPHVIADILTKAGLEVEEIIDQKAKYNNLFVGLILSKEKHPGSERLSLCRVTTGEGVIHQIVCGATNHSVNDKVVVALPGCKLPSGLMIQQTQVRGIDSAGMLCSREEVGLEKVEDGIWLLPKEATIGQTFSKYMGFDDIIMELKVTPNRADCLSHFGLARELSCLLERKLNHPGLRQVSSATEEKGSAKITVDIQSTDACSRYCGLEVSGVNIKPSPDWLQKRLESVGLRSINNVVDITNYIMMELGQPMHAFDANQIKGGKLFIGKAKGGEKFTGLDEKEYVLKGEELIIRDEDSVVAIAGVLGGKHSGVTDTTKNIFLESAFFRDINVRKSSRTHGIQTDSGYRFSRGIDSENCFLALNRAAQMIAEIAEGKISSHSIDHNYIEEKKALIETTIQTVSDRLGYPAEKEKFVGFMQRLGCKVESTDATKISVVPPGFRVDLEGEMDLVEEYARLNGYDKIPESIPSFRKEPTQQNQVYLSQHALGAKLRASGFFQAMNLAMVNGVSEASFLGIQAKDCAYSNGFLPGTQSVKIKNGLSEELSHMRQSIAFSLWKNVLHNTHQGIHFGRAFEIGKIYRKSAMPENAHHDFQFIEADRLGIVAWGYPNDLWNNRLAANDETAHAPLVFEFKNLLERIGDLKDSIQIKPFTEDTPCPFFLHRGQAAMIAIKDKVVGYLGTIHPKLLEDEKIRTSVAILEMDLELLQSQSAPLRNYKPFSRYPSIARDFSVIVANDITAGAMKSEIQEVGGEFLREVDLFDLYSGDKLPPRSKAMGFRMSFQDSNGTLRDDAITASTDRILARLTEKFSASLR